MSLDFNKIKNLYRFFNDEAYNLDGFEQSYLWFNELSRFNDPFETIIKESDIDLDKLSIEELATFCKVNEGLSWHDIETGQTIFPSQVPYEALRGFIASRKEVVVEQLNEYVFKTMHSMQSNKFHCLVHDVDNKPLQSRLMWSHYSNGMRGFVIEFDCDLLLNSQNSLNSSFKGMSDINYMELEFNEYIKSMVRDEKPLFLQHLIFTKHSDWKYENEIRLIGGENKMKYSDSAIKRIIIGEKMPQPKLSHLLRIIENKGLENCTFVAKIERKSFSINLEKFY